jgi:D-3-phosphoglycerate dehydrogenase
MTGQVPVLAVGDSYMPATVFQSALENADGGRIDADVATVTISSEPSWPLGTLREYEGDPAEVSSMLAGYEVLLLHGAPVTRDVLEANPALRLIGCARGGPVNVDLEAARDLGVAVTTTPGKNAPAVADLTIGFVISLLRNVLPSIRDVDETAAEGHGISESAFEGARWFGGELSSRTIGLVGLGNVARLVAQRALALGMDVVAFDPFVAPGSVEGVRQVGSVGELAAQSQVLSVHARATGDNRHLIGERELAALPSGAMLINTARESLVDEAALLAALRTGHLAGAAMDVCESDGPWRELIAMPNVTLTPHIAGATHETLRRGAEMLVSELQRWRRGDDLRWRV